MRCAPTVSTAGTALLRAGVTLMASAPPSAPAAGQAHAVTVRNTPISPGLSHLGRVTATRWWTKEKVNIFSLIFKFLQFLVVEIMQNQSYLIQE